MEDCITLQHTATHCTMLQHTATHCNTLQHTATHCNALQRAGLISEGSELLLEVLDPGIVGGLLLPVLGAFAGEFMYVYIYIYIHIYYREVHIYLYIHICHVVCVWSDSFVCDSFVCDVASAYVLRNVTCYVDRIWSSGLCVSSP